MVDISSEGRLRASLKEEKQKHIELFQSVVNFPTNYVTQIKANVKQKWRKWVISTIWCCSAIKQEVGKVTNEVGKVKTNDFYRHASVLHNII